MRVNLQMYDLLFIPLGRGHLVVVFQNVFEMFVVFGCARLSSGSFFPHFVVNDLLGTLVLHGSDALLLQVLVNLVVVDRVHGDGAPQLGKILIHVKIRGVIMEKYDLSRI